MTNNWLTTLKPYPRADCVEGWNYDEDGWCGVCKGQGGLPVEVHEGCGKEESGDDPCRCYDEVGEKAA